MAAQGHDVLVPLSIGVGLGVLSAVAAARAGPKSLLRLLVGSKRLVTPKIPFSVPREPPVKGLSVVHELSDANVRQLVDMYSQEWWTKDRNFDRVSNMIRYTAVTIGIVDSKNELVGFVRGRSDGEFNTTVSDVIVRKDQRNQGLGLYLMAPSRASKPRV